MDFLVVGVVGDHVVHEVEEFPSTTTRVVSCFDQPGSHLKRREQGRFAMALILMAVAGQGLAAGQPEHALSPFQCLDVRFFVDA